MVNKRAPGPRGTPIGGSLWSFWRNVFTLFDKGREKYGDIVRYRVVRRVYHLLTHPDYINHVMIANRDNYSRRLTHSSQVLHSVTGDSTLTLEGPEWIMRRRLSGSAFSAESLRSYSVSMCKATDALIEKWDVNRGDDVDVQSSMSALTAAIAGATFFGSAVSWDENKLEKSMVALLDHHWQRIKSTTDLVHKLPTRSRRRFNEAMNYLRSIVQGIIVRNESSQEPTLLTKLINARDEEHKLDAVAVQNEVITFLLAGHETTATALLWCFYELTQNPDWQKKIAMEADAMMSGEIKPSDGAPLTNQFFLEVMRLHPPIWLLERQALEDDVIGGFHIPAGSSILMSSLATHRHPDFWDDPDSFDPSRFAGQDAQAQSNAYFPFGLGTHTCIGKKFAMLEGVLVLGRILQRFNVHAVDPSYKPVHQVGITLRMKTPFNIRLSRRVIQ